MGLLVPLAAAACSDDGPGAEPREGSRAHTRLLQAQDAIRLGQHQLALTRLLDLVEEEPGWERAWSSLTVVAERVSNFDVMLRALRELVERHPDDADLHADLVRAALNGGYVDEARTWLLKLQRLDPGTGRTHTLWARLEFEVGDLEEAEKHARRALRLAPGQTIAQHILGVAQEERGEVEDAITCYRAVLSIDPGHRGARYRLSTLLFASGRPKEGRKHADVLEAIKTAMPGAFRKFPPPERIENFGRLTELVPGWPLAHMELGRAYMDAGRLHAARRELRTSLDLAPDSPELHELMAEILRRQGDEEGARNHLSRAGVPWSMQEPGGEEPAPGAGGRAP